MCNPNKCVHPLTFLQMTQSGQNICRCNDIPLVSLLLTSFSKVVLTQSNLTKLEFLFLRLFFYTCTFLSSSRRRLTRRLKHIEQSMNGSVLL